MFCRLVVRCMLSLGILFLTGCGSETKKDEEHAHAHQGHTHAALHGGTLLALGDHFAHLEVVLDSESGKLTIYVQDKEAENSVRISQENLELELTLEAGASDSSKQLALTLSAVSSELTGEKIGDTSEFSVEEEALKGVKKFNAKLKTLHVLGEDFKDLKIRFPEGNEKKAAKEEQHDHDHDH